MERAAWAILEHLHLADKLRYIFGALFLMFIWFEARRRKGGD